MTNNSYKEYDKDTLLRLQSVEIDLLNRFKRICKKYELKYFAVYGTLIGAVRHNGFIPWDDDMDIGMLREDYDKFIAVAQEELGDEVFLQTKETDHKYYLPFAKLRKNGTKFIEAKNSEYQMNLGIYIDVFPFDYLPDDISKGKKQMKKIRFWSVVFSVYHVKAPLIKNRGKIDILVKAIWWLLHNGLKIFGVSREYLGAKIDKYSKELKNSGRTYVTSMGNEPEFSVTLLDNLKEVKEVKYDNTTINIPQEYDAILTESYGDYMQLPPENERVNHCPEIIEFETKCT